MKFINRSSALAFNGTSKDYITKEAVQRANTRLSNKLADHHTALVSTYEKYSIARPTREQIASAGSNAMRKLATTR